MNTQSIARFGWSRLKVNAMGRASSVDKVVLAAKIHGTHLVATDQCAFPERESAELSASWFARAVLVDVQAAVGPSAQAPMVAIGSLNRVAPRCSTPPQAGKRVPGYRQSRKGLHSVEGHQSPLPATAKSISIREFCLIVSLPFVILAYMRLAQETCCAHTRLSCSCRVVVFLTWRLGFGDAGGLGIPYGLAEAPMSLWAPPFGTVDRHFGSSIESRGDAATGDANMRDAAPRSEPACSATASAL
jgi:hypothetical protein